GLVYSSATTGCRVLFRVRRLPAPIRYVGAVARHARQPEQARAFLAFLASAPAQRRFRNCGFLPVGGRARRPARTTPTPNDTDPDGNDKLVPASVAIVTGPAHGSVTTAVNGSITYTAAAGFSGTDTFSYTVADLANAVSNPATVTVVVNRPTANP